MTPLGVSPILRNRARLYSLRGADMKEVRVIHPDQLETEISSGAMTRLAGISQGTVGAEGIHLAIATVPPACKSGAHWHTNCESAIYVLRGHGEFRVGEDLETVLPIAPGDFIYVPAEAIHQPVNTSTTEPMELIVARNTPVELVVEYEPASKSKA